MKPYYQDDAVTIYHADCRDILPELPKVDLVLTDFPYANGTDYGTYNDTANELEALIEVLMPQLFRVSDRVAITTGIGNLYRYPRANWIFAFFIGMEHQQSTPYGFNCWQPILFYGTDPYLAKGLGRRPDAWPLDRLKNPTWFNIDHPCPKPLSTWSQLITRLSLDGQTVLDPLLGSGTTAFAAKKLGRKCIGIEIEERYCEIAAKRCSQMVMALENVPTNRPDLVNVTRQRKPETIQGWM